MSLKIRFALLFSIVVAIILLLSSISIYLLYSDHRKNEYTNQLKSEAMLTFDMFVDKLLEKKDTAIFLSKEVGYNSMQQKCIKIFNTNKESIYSSSLTASSDFKLEKKVFDRIKKQKEYYSIIDNRDFFGVYISLKP